MIAIDKVKMAQIAQKYGLRLIMLFGSQAQKTGQRDSDVDLAFYPSHDCDEQQLYEELVHLLKRADLDLVNLRVTHNHIIRFEILHKGTVLYEEEPGIKSTLEWESYFDFMDFKHYYDLRSAWLEEKIAGLVA